MFDFPNSSAMDATASSGGPSTFLPQIVTGQPQQIAQHSTSMLTKATQFISLLDEFTKASEQLKQVWSGQASESALQKITSSLQSFEKIIQVIQNGAKLLGVSGTLVQSAQTAYKSVVGSVNPTVASLMSNPWTYGAAVALSTTTSATLRAFITAIEGLLQTLGVGQLGTEIASLVTIVTEIEQLITGTQTGTTAATGTTPTTTSIAATPIGTPQAPTSVASTTGLESIQNPITSYTPPALQGYTNPTAPGTGAGAALGQLNGFGVPGLSAAGTTTATAGTDPTTATGTYPTGTYPTGYTDPTTGLTSTNGLTPSIDPSDSWIAVDPSSTPSTAPVDTSGATDAAGAGGQDVSVTTTDGGITTTVSVPAGQAADISLDMTVNNDHVAEHLNIGADGSVKVS
jgi:uncharacterized protein YukE